MVPPPPPPPPPPQPASSSRLEEGMRFGGSETNVKMSQFVVWMNVLTTIAHLLFGAVAFIAFFFVNPYWDYIPKLSSHVYLTVTGYVLLMSQVLLSYNLNTGFTNNLRFPQKRKFHWYLQVIGSGIALIGCCMGISTNDTYFNNHLTSNHAIVGFIAMLLTAVSFVGGIMHLVKWKQMSTVLYEALYTIAFTLTLIFAYAAFGIMFGSDTDINSIMLICLSVFALLLTLIMTYIDLLVRTGYIM